MWSRATVEQGHCPEQGHHGARLPCGARSPWSRVTVQNRVTLWDKVTLWDRVTVQIRVFMWSRVTVWIPVTMEQDLCACQSLDPERNNLQLSGRACPSSAPSSLPCFCPQCPQWDLQLLLMAEGPSLTPVLG